MGLREAFASVIASPGTLLPVLREDPGRIQGRFGLSDEELAVLAGVDGESYAFMAEESGAKRRIHLAIGIPRTVNVLTEHHPRVLDAFLTTTTLAEDLDEPTGIVRACERLLGFDGLPPATADFGRFELDQYLLLGDSVAAEACRPGPFTRLPHIEEGPLMLSPAVRVATYGHDVTDPGAPVRLPREEVTVLLQRAWDAPLRAYRIGSGTGLLLARLDGTRTGREAARDADLPEAEVLDLLERLGSDDIVRAAPALVRQGRPAA
ncbi:hypothetical protein ACFXKW_13110 [Streptomyces sp. NPDC059193]|uniref:hypothetical protein n=1 Tax=Streptomyces sp. NPDC059193 TaxID=3346763 RepID=UPI00368AB496